MYKNRMLKKTLQKGVVNLKYVPTEEQVADVLTVAYGSCKVLILSRQAWCSLKGPLSKEGVTVDR